MPAVLPESRHAVGATVRRLRTVHGWTLAGLAARLGLSTSRLSEVERGKGSFTAEQLLVLFRLFQVGPEAFDPGPPGEDPVSASLQNALVRLGARHLAVDERAPVRAEHARPVGVLLDVLVAHPEARLLTALPPVVVRQIDHVPFAAVQHGAVQAGVPGRWPWLLEHARAALEVVGNTGDTAWLLQRRRALTLIERFLARLPHPDPEEPFDLIDPELRHPASVQRAERAASVIDQRWRVLGRLTVADFAGPLEAVRDGL